MKQPTHEEFSILADQDTAEGADAYKLSSWYHNQMLCRRKLLLLSLAYPAAICGVAAILVWLCNL